ncbi:MAG: S41 family peptidase [Peptostreptococcales bacterium]
MRYITFSGYFYLLLFILQCNSSKAFEKTPYKVRANTKVKYIIIDGTGYKVSIPDNLLNYDYHVYCYKEHPSVTVEVVSDVDSISFRISENESIQVVIEFQERDNLILNFLGVNKLPDGLTLYDKMFYISKLYSEIKFNFVNYDRLHFDLDSLQKQIMREAIDTRNDYSFYRVLKRFFSLLEEGHTEIYDGGAFKSYIGYVPITVQEVGNRFFITSVREDLVSFFELGDEILEINRVTVENYVNDSIIPYISGSTPHFRKEHAIAQLTTGLKESPIEIKWVKKNGLILKDTFRRNGEETRYDRYGNEKYKRIGNNARFKPNLDLEYLSDSIAILEMNRFWPEQQVIKSFIALVPKVSNAKGLVIDLRNNSGGSTGVAHEILKRIINEKYFLGLEGETRVNDAVYRALGYGYDEYNDYFKGVKYRTEEADTIFIPDTLHRINCPIVILIGGNTFSAAEDFLIMLYEVIDRPLFIGTETAGSTGLPLVIPNLPYNGYARITTRRVIFPYSKKKFANEGIIPDIIIKPTIEDILLGSDIVLERAIQILRSN